MIRGYIEKTIKEGHMKKNTNKTAAAAYRKPAPDKQKTTAAASGKPAQDKEKIALPRLRPVRRMFNDRRAV